MSTASRTYVVTGEPRYRDWFQEILRIRDGTAPRPRDYDGIYWDVVTDTGNRPTPFERPAAFATMSKPSEVTQEGAPLRVANAPYARCMSC